MRSVFFGFWLMCSLLNAQVKVRIQWLDADGAPAPFVSFGLTGGQRPMSMITNLDGEAICTLSPFFKGTVMTTDPRFKKFSTRIFLGASDTLLRFQLTPKISQNEQEILDLEGNPAQRMIHEAIRRRVWNQRRQEQMTMDAVTGVRITVDTVRAHFPRFWVFSQVPDSSKKGVQYVSQSFSHLYFKAFSSNIFEDITDFREAGDRRQWPFAYDARGIHQFNLYQSESTPLAFSDELFISPISWGAFQYYRFSVIEKFYRSGVRIHRIKVTPINPYGPVWSGEICIAEGSWALQEVRLSIKDPAPIYRVDSLVYEMDGRRFPGDFWYSIRTSMKAWKRIYGTDITYEVFATYHHHQFPEDSLSVPLLQKYRLTDKALNYDEAFWSKWATALPEEEKDFCAQDSILQLQCRKPDDLPVESHVPPFKWTDLLLGRTTQNEAKRSYLFFDGLLNDKMEFNTVEGFVLKQSLHWKRAWRNGWMMHAEPIIRYGFQDRVFKAKGRLKWENPLHSQSWTLEGGRWMNQINQSEPIHSIINSIYTLLLRRNFMKLYRQDYVKVQYNRELVNGLYMSAGMEWSSRTTLENTSDFSLIPYPGRDFSPNNPNMAFDPDYQLLGHRRMLWTLGLTFKPFQPHGQYLTEKKVFPSPLPVVSVFFSTATPWLGSKAHYSLVSFAISQDIPLRLLGTGSYIFKAGYYLSTKEMTYLDYTHFLGEQTYFLGSSANATYLDQFRALDYYQYSTNRPYIEVHFQHNFRGFPLTQIPLLKKLRFNHYAGLNALVIFDNNFSNYSEVYYGVDNILGAIKPLRWFNLRVDVAMRVRETGFFAPTVLVGLGTRFFERR